MARASNSERVTAVKGDSVLSLAASVAAGATSTFDVIYVDGGHTVRLERPRQTIAHKYWHFLDFPYHAT